MKLPSPPPRYDQEDQAAMRLLLEQLAIKAYQRDQAIQNATIKSSKIEIGTVGNFVLTAPNGNRYEVKVSNTGTLTTTLL